MREVGGRFGGCRDGRKDQVPMFDGDTIPRKRYPMGTLIREFLIAERMTGEMAGKVCVIDTIRIKTFHNVYLFGKPFGRP